MRLTVRSSRLFIVTLAAVLVTAGTFALGQWQLRRAAEKKQLQAAIVKQSRRTALDAQAIAAVRDLSLETHRLVCLVGVWEKDRTIFVDNRPMDGKTGFWVYTPFVLNAGATTVLVQRGWVARDFLDRSKLPAVQTPAGLVRVQGRMAPPPSKLYAFKGNDTGQIRQNIDLAVLRLETGLQLLEASIVQLDAPSEGLLRVWPAPDTGVDRHYGYAFQWFSLCVLTVGLYGWFQLLLPYRKGQAGQTRPAS